MDPIGWRSAACGGGQDLDRGRGLDQAPRIGMGRRGEDVEEGAIETRARASVAELVLAGEDLDRVDGPAHGLARQQALELEHKVLEIERQSAPPCGVDTPRSLATCNYGRATKGCNRAHNLQADGCACTKSACAGASARACVSGVGMMVFFAELIYSGFAR